MKIKKFLRLKFQEKVLHKGDGLKIVGLKSKYYTGEVVKVKDEVVSLNITRKGK